MREREGRETVDWAAAMETESLGFERYIAAAAAAVCWVWWCGEDWEFRCWFKSRRVGEVVLSDDEDEDRNDIMAN